MMASSSSLKAEFYAIRRNGTFVPLIAMDEIPTTIAVRDVPRILEARETVGMISVGEYDSRHTYHGVEFKDARNPFLRSVDGSYNTNTNIPNRTLLASKHASNGLTTELGYPAPPRAFGIREQPPSNAAGPLIGHDTPLRIDRKAIVSTTSPNESRVPSPLPSWHESANLPRANGIKTYCSYWLRHGECDYAQQGCLYKHEMPLDLPTLKECGMRDVPRWYRELHGVGSLLAVPGSDGSKDRDQVRKGCFGDNWRDGQSTTSNTKAAIIKSNNIGSKTFPIPGMKKGLITIYDPNPVFANTSCGGVDNRRNKSSRNTTPSRRADSKTTYSVPVGTVVTTGQAALMESVRQLKEFNEQEAKFKEDIARRASKNPSTNVNRPASSGTDSTSTSPLLDEISVSGHSESAGTKPGFNTPATIYSVTGSEAEVEDDETKPSVTTSIPAAGLGITLEVLKDTVPRYQAEQTKAREEVLNNIVKSLSATEASQTAQPVSSPKARGKARGKRGGVAGAARRARNESQSSISTTGAIDGDAGSLDGRNPGSGSVKAQPIGDLLEGFEMVEPSAAAVGDADKETIEVMMKVDEDKFAEGMRRLDVGTKGYVPYDHDD